MKFAFIHIPKTAGTTVANILKKQCKVYHRDINARPKDFQKYDVCMGHFFPEIYEEFPKVTWFRKPLERMISHYSYFKLRVHKENKHSIVIYPDKPGDTAQKKMDPNIDIVSFAEKIGCVYIKYTHGNIKQFDFIGFVETMQTSLVQFGRKFNVWVPTNTPRDRKGTISLITEKEREKVKEIIQMDMQIYKKARKEHGW